MTLTEHAESADEQIEQRTGLGRDQIERAIEILIGAGLVREGTLVG